METLLWPLRPPNLRQKDCMSGHPGISGRQQGNRHVVLLARWTRKSRLVRPAKIWVAKAIQKKNTACCILPEDCVRRQPCAKDEAIWRSSFQMTHWTNVMLFVHSVENINQNFTLSRCVLEDGRDQVLQGPQRQDSVWKHQIKFEKQSSLQQFLFISIFQLPIFTACGSESRVMFNLLLLDLSSQVPTHCQYPGGWIPLA